MAVCNDFIHCECASIVEEMEWEQGELMKARDELLEALENLLKVHEGEGGTQHHAGDMARAAIAKAKGERRVLPSPQEPDSFTVGAARAAIAKAKGVE
jgi:hypothetical protein